LEAQKRQKDNKKVQLFPHILGLVVKFNEVICLLSFYCSGTLICCVIEYLGFSI